MRPWYVALAILIAPVGAAAQQPGQASGGSSLTGIFEAANLAASRGDHSGAISNYRKLTEAGVRDPDVCFNLATSFAQSGDYARAILNYERRQQSLREPASRGKGVGGTARRGRR